MVKYGFFSRTQNTILSAAFVLALAYGVSALLGLVRSRLMATFFGDSLELSVFYIADRIPSLIYSILAVGALATVFIPVFAEELEKNKQRAFEMASKAITLCVLTYLIFSVFVFLLAGPIISLISVGQLGHREVVLGARIMQILLFSQLLLVLSSFYSSILQSFRYFLIPALAPILYNLGLISGTVLLASDLNIYAPAIGSVMGALLHLALQAFFVKNTGFSYKFKFEGLDAFSLKIAKLLPARILALAAGQISLTINNAIAVLISTASVIYLKFADQLQSFPVNFFGASIALAALPALSMKSTEKDLTEFKRTFFNTFFQMMYLAVPSSVILLILRVPAVRLVYGASAFPWEATLQTALVLGIFSVSIFPQSASLLLNRVFYAFKDTKTPLMVSLIAVFLSTTTALLLVTYFKLGIWAVALAMVLGSAVEFLLLLFFVQKRLGGFTYLDFFQPFLKISLSALAMGVCIYGPLKLLDIRVFDTTKTLELIILTIVVTTSGVLAYFFITRLLKVKEVELFYKLLYKLRFKKALSPSTPIVPILEEDDIV